MKQNSNKNNDVVKKMLGFELKEIKKNGSSNPSTERPKSLE